MKMTERLQSCRWRVAAAAGVGFHFVRGPNGLHSICKGFTNIKKHHRAVSESRGITVVYIAVMLQPIISPVKISEQLRALLQTLVVLLNAGRQSRDELRGVIEQKHAIFVESKK
jgi:hypothetical protein